MQCNVELLDDCIKHLKRGTAAGLGELTVEHLLYAHPVLVVLLSLLECTVSEDRVVLCEAVFCEAVVHVKAVLECTVTTCVVLCEAVLCEAVVHVKAVLECTVSHHLCCVM